VHHAFSHLLNKYLLSTRQHPCLVANAEDIAESKTDKEETVMGSKPGNQGMASQGITAPQYVSSLCNNWLSEDEHCLMSLPCHRVSTCSL
jgi:hypothetical protein